MDIITYKFEEVEVRRKTIEKCLGYFEDDIPEPFPSLIDEAFDVVPKLCNLQAGYCYADRIELTDQLIINNIGFDAKNTVIKLLNNTEKVALFVCTIGDSLEKLSKKEMAEGDMMKGWVLDVMASTTVDAVAEKLHKLIENEADKEGLKITNRYSPGYCGWSVSEQHKLFTFFPEKPLGIELSDTSLMHPIKSVSGIIGLGKAVKFNPYTCQICKEECIYKNIRTP
jgi:hypothetical protein